MLVLRLMVHREEPRGQRQLRRVEDSGRSATSARCSRSSAKSAGLAFRKRNRSQPCPMCSRSLRFLWISLTTVERTVGIYLRALDFVERPLDLHWIATLPIGHGPSDGVDQSKASLLQVDMRQCRLILPVERDTSNPWE
jgi:hypothetical protein